MSDRNNSIAIVAVLVVFFNKYFSSMMMLNTFWRSGEWYQFLEQPSAISQAGLLDPAAMAPYYGTLSISLGHQLIASVNRWLGFELGTAFLYITIVSLFTAAIYFLSLQLTQSRIKAFVIAFVLMNTDYLAMAHIGACGHIAQGPTRDHLAISFFLFATYFLLKSRLLLYWACLYIGFLLHLTHGLFAFILLLPVTLSHTRNIRFISLHVFSFLVTALGLYAYQSFGAEPLAPEIRELWFKWVYIFNGGHIFFDHSIGYLVPNYAFFSIAIASITVSITSSLHQKVIIPMLLMWCCVAVAATMFIYIIPTMLGYQLTPYRSSLFACVVFSIVIFNSYIESVNRDSPVWKLILIFFGLIAAVSGTFFGIVVFATVACVLSATNYQGWRRIFSLLASVGCAAFLVLTLKEYSTYDAFVVARDRTDWALTAGVLLTLALAVKFLRRGREFSRHAYIAGLGTLLLFVAVFTSRYVAAPPQDRLDSLDDYLRASSVIKEHSNESEPALVAPLIFMPMLEISASRGSILQLVKAHVPYMAPQLLPVFDKTLQSFGIDIANFNGTWVDLVRDSPKIWKDKMTDDYTRRMGEQYGAKLLLTDRDHALSFDTLYEGKYFTVYSLPPLRSNF